LSSLVIEDIDDSGTILRLRVRTTMPEGVCPECGTASRRVHAWHLRRLTDLPVAGRGVVVQLRVRRLVCLVPACVRRTFREQVPQLAARCARRTLRLTAAVGRDDAVRSGQLGPHAPPTAISLLPIRMGPTHA
jgi:transposase